MKLKTRPIVLERNSGTKYAGKKICKDDWKEWRTATIKFVGDNWLIADVLSMKMEEVFNVCDDDWLEVLPDDPPVHEEFFKLYGDCFARSYGECYLDPSFERTYAAFKSRLIAELGLRDSQEVKI